MKQPTQKQVNEFVEHLMKVCEVTTKALHHFNVTKFSLTLPKSWDNLTPRQIMESSDFRRAFDAYLRGKYAHIAQMIAGAQITQQVVLLKKTLISVIGAIQSGKTNSEAFANFLLTIAGHVYGFDFCPMLHLPNKTALERQIVDDFCGCLSLYQMLRVKVGRKEITIYEIFQKVFSKAGFPIDDLDRSFVSSTTYRADSSRRAINSSVLSRVIDKGCLPILNRDEAHYGDREGSVFNSIVDEEWIKQRKAVLIYTSGTLFEAKSPDYYSNELAEIYVAYGEGWQGYPYHDGIEIPSEHQLCKELGLDLGKYHPRPFLAKPIRLVSIERELRMKAVHTDSYFIGLQPEMSTVEGYICWLGRQNNWSRKYLKAQKEVWMDYVDDVLKNRKLIDGYLIQIIEKAFQDGHTGILVRAPRHNGICEEWERKLGTLTRFKNVQKLVVHGKKDVIRDENKEVLSFSQILDRELDLKKPYIVLVTCIASYGVNVPNSCSAHITLNELPTSTQSHETTLLQELFRTNGYKSVPQTIYAPESIVGHVERLVKNKFKSDRKPSLYTVSQYKERVYGNLIAELSTTSASLVWYKLINKAVQIAYATGAISLVDEHIRVKAQKWVAILNELGVFAAYNRLCSILDTGKGDILVFGKERQELANQQMLYFQSNDVPLNLSTANPTDLHGEGRSSFMRDYFHVGYKRNPRGVEPKRQHDVATNKLYSDERSENANRITGTVAPTLSVRLSDDEQTLVVEHTQMLLREIAEFRSEIGLMPISGTSKIRQLISQE